MAKKDEWMEMRISGILAWLHKLVMLVTLPIRRFWIIFSAILIVLIILLAIPLYNGAKAKDIFQWYKQLFKNSEIAEITEKTETALMQKINAAKKKISDVKQAPEEKDEVHFTAWNVAEFKKAVYEPRKIMAPAEEKIETSKNIKEYPNIENQKEKSEADKPVVNEVREHQILEKQIQDVYDSQLPYKGKLEDYYIKMQNPNLAYLNMPEKIAGTAEVFGSNSLYINDRLVILYGIYTDPDLYDVKQTKHYLANMAEGKEIYCEILAYKVQTQAATALCFVNGIFINKSLVDHNLALNVSLK